MNILYRSKRIAWIIGVSLLATALSAAAADAGSRDADAWKFGAELYLWAPWIDVTTETGGDVEISLDDILNNLDMLFMGALGVGKDKWSLVADIIYFDIENNESSDRSPRAEIRSVDLSAWVVTPQVRYSAFETTEYRIDLLAGARYLDYDLGSDEALSDLTVHGPYTGVKFAF